MELFGENSQLFKTVDYIYQQDPSYMVDSVLDKTLPNKLLQLAEDLTRNFPPWDYTRESLTHHTSQFFWLKSKAKTKRLNTGLTPRRHFLAQRQEEKDEKRDAISVGPK